MTKKPRVTKSKQEIQQVLEKKAAIEKQKTDARKLFPMVQGLDTAYDAQTVFNAVAGYIQAGIEVRESKIKVSDLDINTTKEKPNKVSDAAKAMIEAIQDEPARDMVTLLQMMGNSIPQFLSLKYLKGGMEQIPMDEFIAE